MNLNTPEFAVGNRSINLVIIHNGVEGLDPHGVDVTIQDNPLWGLTGIVRQIPHDARIEAC